MTTNNEDPTISGFADKNPENPWAMQIIVQDNKDFTGLDLSYATAKSVLHYLQASTAYPKRLDAIDEWLAGRFRKVLRRAKNAAWDKLQDVDGETYTFNNVTIRVLTPMTMSELPKEVKKAQVSGLQVLPNTISYVQDDDYALTIFTNRSLNMSAGKTAAAAAHVAQRAFIDLMNYAYAQNIPQAKKDVDKWISAKFPIKVSTLGFIEKHIAAQTDVAIHDAGLTEVETGSITGIGIHNRRFFD